VSGDDPLIGQTIDGRYLVRRFIGKGGMGRVYEAEHVGLHKRVAIKFLPEDNDADALARFRREARTASQISHEHVVHVFDVGTTNGREYFAMEYVEGKSLQKVLDEEGALAPERAVAIAHQLLAGLGAVHAAGLVHRDIKPANVLLATREDGGDFVKVMDFGLSKTVAMGDDTITSVGRVVGTPQFMAPEQIAGAVVDARADLYAAGICMYAMLVGKVPFAGSKVTKVAAQHLTERPPSVATLRPGLPAAVVMAVARALEKEPQSRFQSAREFADALDGKAAPRRASAKTLSDRPAKAGPDAPTRMMTPGRRVWLAAALLAIVMAVVAAFLLQR
jgi:serine/threonine-protein kinase